MTEAEVRLLPYPHTTGLDALSGPEADLALAWMKDGAPWRLKVASFYEQWELPIDSDVLPPGLRQLSEAPFISGLAARFMAKLTDKPLILAEITAHKLVKGQTIRIHNDYIEGHETHRLLIQLNDGWQDEQGGLLLLFGSASHQDVKRIVRPKHRSGFAFKISLASYHAVSTIQSGQRFTLVYSFRQALVGQNVCW